MDSFLFRKLKDNKENYKISWSIISSASGYKNISKRCNLCFTEKLHITLRCFPHSYICVVRNCALIVGGSSDKTCNHNKRNELISKCHHTF